MFGFLYHPLPIPYDESVCVRVCVGLEVCGCMCVGLEACGRMCVGLEVCWRMRVVRAVINSRGRRSRYDRIYWNEDGNERLSPLYPHLFILFLRLGAPLIQRRRFELTKANSGHLILQNTSEPPKMKKE